MNRLRSILVSVLCCWITYAVCCNELDENLAVWNATIVNQLQLTQFIDNVTMYTDHWNTTNCLYLSLTGGTNYELDIVKLMKISVNGSLVMESEGGSADMNCTIDPQYDLEELSQTLQPLSRASLVLLDGLIFTGCPVPILIEEASNVAIQNCVFQHHKHGALNIYNSENITVKNCTFHNNTSDGLFITRSYQGGAGGLSIGYNYHHSTVLINSVNILIIKCTFTSNTATTLSRLTSSEILESNTFPGRGGAFSLLVFLKVPLNFTFNDSLVINNFASGFGGGIFCTIHNGALYQTFLFANNIFMNNTSPATGGLSFINMLNKPVEFVVYILIYNCTFVGNTAGGGGAANITPLNGLNNTVATFRDCSFYNNSALIYSGAVDVTSYEFFDNKEASFPIEFINCVFDGNRADDGAAVNIAYYSVKFTNVTFRNNKESAIRVIGGKMEFCEEVSFINNEVDGSVGGAIYLLLSSQMFLEADTHLKFINNTGRSGAAIVVEADDILSLLDEYFINNPFCFLQYYNSSVPLGEISHDEVSMEFIGNNAIVGSAIYSNNLNFCSWSSYYSPFLYNTSSVFRWPFIAYRNNGINDSEPVQTPAVDFLIQNDTVLFMACIFSQIL